MPHFKQNRIYEMYCQINTNYTGLLYIVRYFNGKWRLDAKAGIIRKQISIQTFFSNNRIGTYDLFMFRINLFAE